MNCEAGLLLNCENPTPGSHFCGQSTHEQQMTFPIAGLSESCPISAHYRTFFSQDKRGGFGAKHDDKAPPWVMLKPWSDSIPPTPSTTKLPPPIRAARRRSPCRGGGRAGSPRRVARRPTRCCNKRFRLGRGRRTSQPSAPTRASRRLSAPAPASLCSTKFFALDPPFAGALRQRLALRAADRLRRAGAPARRFFRAARRRTSRADRGANTSPAGRIHRLWRAFALRPSRLDAPTLRTAADLLGLSDAAELRGVRRRPAGPHVADAETPLAAAAGASAAAMKLFGDAPRVDAEIFALWLSDLVLARRLGWDAPVPLLGTAIAHPSWRRSAAGKRPRPGDADWADALVRAYALAARDAFAVAGELSRRSQSLLAAAPKLRAKGAGRVVELLLGDDAISPATAAKAAGLSDRASRRLFDRLVELGAVRELSGRANFRLYGL